MTLRQHLLHVVQRVSARRRALHSSAFQRSSHRGVSHFRIRFYIVFPRHQINLPRLARSRQHHSRFAVQHQQRTAAFSQRRVQVAQRLQQEPHAIRPHPRGLTEPRIEHEHRLRALRARDARGESGIIVDAQRFAKPNQRTRRAVAHARRRHDDRARRESLRSAACVVGRASRARTEAVEKCGTTRFD